MKHLGDITRIRGDRIPPVDIITGGSPCQDLSVAGKRSGLTGKRSGLFLEQIRITKEMRGATNGKKPRFMLWENVPGAFSSNRGEDFRTVLEETARVADEDAAIPRPEEGKWTPTGFILGDGWSIAWRTHDARYWGVPQRRKRISLLADFCGESADQILFELWRVTEEEKEEPFVVDSGEQSGSQIQPQCQGVSWHPAEGGGKNEEAAADAGGGVEAASGAISFAGRAGKLRGDKEILVCLNDQGGKQMDVSQDLSGTLRAEAHGNLPIVYGISAHNSNAMLSPNPNCGIYEAAVARTLDQNGGSPACNQGGMAVVSMAAKQQSLAISEEMAATLGGNDHKEPQVICIEGNGSRPSHQGDGFRMGDPMYTLNGTEQHAVCVEMTSTRNSVSDDGICYTLTARMGTGGNQVHAVAVENSYPKIVGSLCASGYEKLGVQEAANDMFVVQEQQGFAMQAIGEYKASEAASALKERDYKDVTDIVVDQMTYQQHTGTLDCDISKGVNNQIATNDMLVANPSTVRRLTPLECTRLQGFPDRWVDIGNWIDTKNKRHKDSDGPKYRALGNSLALPFWAWLAKRMVARLDTATPTMGSLFDGIGGFPLVFSWAGCKPLWASEIEEFPIAVTKRWFPEEMDGRRQYCRYCIHLYVGDAPYCDVKKQFRSVAACKSQNRCKNYEFANVDAESQDAFRENIKGYRPRRYKIGPTAAEAAEYEQLSLELE